MDKEETLLFEATWMNLKDIIVAEISQTWKNTLHALTTYGILKILIH